jgi:protein-disulfide isomerase
MSSPFQVLPGRLAVPVTDEDHVKGPATAPVTLVEYGDYQCPYCGMAHPIVNELLARRPDTIRFVFRHFPLANIHPYAEVAAEGAEAAGTRRKFWAVHDWLFEHQDRLDPTYIRLAAAQLGLDADEVLREISEHAYLGRIRRDLVGGARSGVNGTPTFFVNGTRHDGNYALPDLLAAVDEAASRA